MWDLSFYGSGSGADIGPYIKQRLNIKFDMYIWILDYD